MTTTSIIATIVLAAICSVLIFLYTKVLLRYDKLKNSVIDIQYNLTNRGVNGNTLASDVCNNTILIGKLLKHLNLNVKIEPAIIAEPKIVLIENKPEESTNKNPTYGGITLLSENDKIELREHCLNTAHMPGKDSGSVLKAANEYYNFVVNGMTNKGDQLQAEGKECNKP